MLVKHLMTPDVRSCPPDATVAGAARIMSARECGIVPIVDLQDRLVGVVTDRDLCLVLAGQARNPRDLLVTEVMTRKVYTCSPEDDTAAALKVMKHHLVRRLPVVSPGGRLVGLLSIDDIVARVGSAPRAEIEPAEVIDTLKALASHIATV